MKTRSRSHVKDYSDLKMFLIAVLLVVLFRKLFQTQTGGGPSLIDRFLGAPSSGMLKNEGAVGKFCDERSLKEMISKIEMSNPTYKGGDKNQKSEKYESYKLSYVNNFIIHTLNQASGGCFRNIGFDKVKFNGGKWDTVIHLYEQKKYFGVMLRAVIQESADGKLSVVYIGMLSPMPVDTKFSPSTPPPMDQEIEPTAVEFVELQTDGHLHGVHSVAGISRNEEYKHLKLKDTPVHHEFDEKSPAPVAANSN